MKILAVESKKSILSKMISAYNLEETAQLCLALGVNFEDIAPFAGIGLRIKNLIEYMERRGRIVDLVNQLEIERENIKWEPMYQKVEIAEEYYDITIDDSELKLQRNAIRAILKACYRRAIFTRTPLEINIHDMFMSLEACQQEIMPHVMDIVDVQLQQTASNIITLLDHIERIGKRSREEYLTDFVILERIDDLKLNILNLLFKLAKGANLSYTLPTSLAKDAPHGMYFGPEEAKQPPNEDGWL